MAFRLSKNQKYLLGCSYGPDSMALFSMLKKGGYDFAVAHVNYGLRPEAKLETQKLKEYCAEQGVNIFVLQVKELDSKVNVEAECRKIRYQFFKKVVEKKKFDAVLIAHNEDDLIETYLMQKNRKSLVKHYGIAENTKIYDTTIIRPLLDITKADLQKYCDKNNVPYAIDSSNLTDDFERNKIRHNTVSKMGKEKRREVILEIDAKNRQVEARTQYLSCIDLNVVENLRGLDDEFLAVALNLMIKRHEPTASVSLPLAGEIRKILDSTKPNVRFPISQTLVFEKTYDTCKFSGIQRNNFSFILKAPGVLDTEFFYLDFSTGGQDRNVTVNDYPLTIRRVNPTDKYKIKDYTVQVRRLFIDWKMPLDLRERWPAIVNCNGEIIYIPRYRKDFKKKYEDNFYVKINEVK